MHLWDQTEPGFKMSSLSLTTHVEVIGDHLHDDEVTDPIRVINYQDQVRVSDIRMQTRSHSPSGTVSC